MKHATQAGAAPGQPEVTVVPFTEEQFRLLLMFIHPDRQKDPSKIGTAKELFQHVMKHRKK